MSILSHPAPRARPVAIVTGLVVAAVTYAVVDSLSLPEGLVVTLPIGMGLAAAALARRAMHRRALERAARDHNARG